MNINLLKLYNEMNGKSWDDFPKFWNSFRYKKKFDFSLLFEPLEINHTSNKNEIKTLPRADFFIFGNNPKKDPFDLIKCDQCHLLYRLQAFELLHDHNNHIVQTPTKSHKKSELKQHQQQLQQSHLIPIDILNTEKYNELHERINKIIGKKKNTVEKLEKLWKKYGDKKKVLFSLNNDLINSKLYKNLDINSLNREDFPIFGIGNTNSEFDMIQCDKCNLLFKINAFEQHSLYHTKLNKVNSNSTSSRTNTNKLEPIQNITPTKAQKKEIVKHTSTSISDRYNKISDVNIESDNNDIVSNDIDMISSDEISYPSDNSNSNNIININKTDVEYNIIIPNNNNHFVGVNNFTGIKIKHGQIDKKIKTKEKSKVRNKTKEFDPNKHCGVCTETNGWEPCLRSLTCKTHSVLLRRNVPGRCKSFDKLLAEHKNLSKVNKNKKDTILASSPAPVSISSSPSSSQEMKTISPNIPHKVIKHEQILPPPLPLQQIPSSVPLSIPSSIPIKEEPIPMIIDKQEFDSIYNSSHYKPLEDFIDMKPILRSEIIYTRTSTCAAATTTRVRKSKHKPLPLNENISGLFKYNKRIYQTHHEAYCLHLLKSNITQQIENTLRLNTVNIGVGNNRIGNGINTLDCVARNETNRNLTSTININSIKKTIYPHEFFNLKTNTQYQT